ncbi:MAG: prepilin-type cleavage/methylation domain-containing protein, partial [Curvibacter sp.]|nr:prepilin-type cleavage/methylation domain-containing protein [Curvibacter sp.]
GMVPGDNPTTPTGQVNGANMVGGVSPELCGTALLNTFQAAGIALPQGRTEGQSDRYVYLDSNGNPQEAQVCFYNVSWADAGATVGSYVLRPRNVMELKSLTPALANMLDAQIDGKSDARFGNFREDDCAGQTTTNSAPWGVDETVAYGSVTVSCGSVATNASPLDESQVAVVTAYQLMSR